MKLHDAIKLIESSEQQPKGFMVSCERLDPPFLRSDHFPDKAAGEPLFSTEEIAWDLAKRFAAATEGTYYNIYVVDHHFFPVKGYTTLNPRRET